MCCISSYREWKHHCHMNPSLLSRIKDLTKLQRTCSPGFGTTADHVIVCSIWPLFVWLCCNVIFELFPRILWCLAGVWPRRLDRGPPPAFGRGPSCRSCDAYHRICGLLHRVRQQHCHNYHLFTHSCRAGKARLLTQINTWCPINSSSFCCQVLHTVFAHKNTNMLI